MGNSGFFHASLFYGISGELDDYAGSVDDIESSVRTWSAHLLHHGLIDRRRRMRNVSREN